MKVDGLLCAVFALAALSRVAEAGESTTAERGSSPPSASHAGTASDPDVAAARAAFERGSSLSKSGDWEGALAAFEQSARLKPHPITTYDIAFCERALGRYVRATLHFEEALSVAGTALLPRELVSDATRCLDEVRPRIVHVAVERHPDDLAITVDGMPLEAVRAHDGLVFVVAASATAKALPRGPIELWLDPGTHVFVGSGPDDARVVESRTFSSGEASDLTLSLSERPTPPPPAPPAPPDVSRPRPNHTAAYIAFGVGGVGLLGAAVFSGLALSEKHSLDTDHLCVDKECPASYADRESRMVTFADLATASVATLAAGAAVGTYLLLTAPSSTTKSARLTPFVAGTYGGVVGRF